MHSSLFVTLLDLSVDGAKIVINLDPSPLGGHKFHFSFFKLQIEIEFSSTFCPSFGASFAIIIIIVIIAIIQSIFYYRFVISFDFIRLAKQSIS